MNPFLYVIESCLALPFAIALFLRTGLLSPVSATALFKVCVFRLFNFVSISILFYLCLTVKIADRRERANDARLHQLC